MEKLYDKDAYMTEFSAKVEDCFKRGGKFCVILDKTAFFPTAGGQDCDTGALSGRRILCVEEENGTIVHCMKEPIPKGTDVTGKIDWDARFRKMQHHSAEHIISGLAHSMFGLNNVGFHLSDKEVTMDYDGELTEEKINLLESAANRVVQDNRKITAEYPSKEKLKALEYRAKLDLTENVRIVTIDGTDICACCAPHVRNTGEIGIIKITDAMRHRGGMRMRMICGMDAYFDYCKKQTEVRKISALFSAKQDEIAAAAEQKLTEISQLKQKIGALSRAAAEQRAESISETDGNICIFEDDADMNALRNIVNICKKKCTGFAAVLSGNDKNGYNYIIASEKIPLRALSADMNNALSGRGGGRDDMLQGHFGADKNTIKKYLAELK